MFIGVKRRTADVVFKIGVNLLAGPGDECIHERFRQ